MNSANWVTRATRVGWPLLLSFSLLLTSGRAKGDESEVEAALKEWSETPLDLSSATAEEIALLPWVSSAEAVAIETLVRLGQLRRFSDLERIPGFTAQQSLAIEPYVQLPDGANAREPLRWQLVNDARQDGQGGRQWTRLRARGGSWQAGGRRGPDGSLSLAYVGLGRQSEGTRWSVGLGRFRPRSSSPLLLSDPTARSRSAPLSWPTVGGPWVSPTLSAISQERAITVGASTGAHRWRVFHDPQGPTRSWAEWSLGGEGWRWSAAVAEPADARREYLLQWQNHLRRFDIRLDLAGRPGAARSFAQLRWVGQGRRLGVGLTRSTQVTANARDPISFSRLDRPHLGWQIDLRQAQPTWRLSSMLRRLERAGTALHRWRLWLDPRGLSPRSWRWQLRVGVDESPRDIGEESPRSSMDLDLHLSLRQLGPDMSRRLRLWWRGQRGASARAVAFDFRRGRSWQWRSTLAAATGSRSLPWAAGLPAGALRVRWLQPGQALVLASLTRRFESQRLAAEFGAWLLAASALDDTPELEGGWGLRISGRSGAKVAP